MSRPTNNFFKLDMIFLSILNQQDCYGYQMTQIISQCTDNHIYVKEGTMYPILYRLMDDGYISSEKVLVGKRLTRIYYHIEPKGKEYLNDLYNEYNQTIIDIQNIMSWGGNNNE